TVKLEDYAASADNFALTLEAGCNQLITRFGPTAWKMDRGQLVMLLAKGQIWRFEESDPTTWRRVPEGRQPLILSKPRMRILAFDPGAHDASAAACDDHPLVAAVGEEGLTRRKGSGDGVPWLAIDEVLTIAGWRGIDVDAIALTREFVPPRYLHYAP